MKQTNLNLSLYNDKVVKIKLEKNTEIPYVYGELIALIQYDDILKAYVMNHPYDIKRKMCIAGDAAFAPCDVLSIVPANEEESTTWVNAYMEFHDSIVKEKGYDFCKLDDVNKYLPTVNLSFK